MRSDRLLLVLFVLAACEPEPATQGKGNQGRFDAVKSGAGNKKAGSARGFCDRSFPASGEGSVVFEPPPTRPVPGAPPTATPPSGGWRWVNVWATWCEPCREEMALLGRWREAAARDGAPFQLELLSVDAEAAAPALVKAIEQGLPGRVTWVRAEAEVEPFFERIGAGKDAAIPIQAIVDPAGRLRCVRVGAVHDRDYGAVRALLAGE